MKASISFPTCKRSYLPQVASVSFKAVEPLQKHYFTARTLESYPSPPVSVQAFRLNRGFKPLLTVSLDAAHGVLDGGRRISDKTSAEKIDRKWTTILDTGKEETTGVHTNTTHTRARTHTLTESLLFRQPCPISVTFCSFSLPTPIHRVRDC